MQMIALEEPTDDQAPTKASSGKSESLADYFTQLYKIGTGWLGWSPEQTWDATPAEIRAAYEGRIDLLKTIFGAKDDKPAAPAKPETLTQRIRSAFAGLGTTKVKRAD